MDIWSWNEIKDLIFEMVDINVLASMCNMHCECKTPQTQQWIH